MQTATRGTLAAANMPETETGRLRVTGTVSFPSVSEGAPKLPKVRLSAVLAKYRRDDRPYGIVRVLEATLAEGDEWAAPFFAPGVDFFDPYGDVGKFANGMQGNQSPVLDIRIQHSDDLVHGAPKYGVVVTMESAERLFCGVWRECRFPGCTTRPSLG